MNELQRALLDMLYKMKATNQWPDGRLLTRVEQGLLRTATTRIAHEMIVSGVR